MITIIIGTNRGKSGTERFAQRYYEMLEQQGEEVHLLHLKNINPMLYHSEMYDEALQPELLEIQKNLLLPAHKFVFVIPEYNGGMPGALKLFIDALSIYERSLTFGGKKAAIVGVSTGRAGNLRGMEHLTSILHYLEIVVLPNRQPYSSIHQLMDNNGVIVDATTEKIIENHVRQIIAF